MGQGLHQTALGLVPDAGQPAVRTEQQEERVDELARLLLPLGQDVHALFAYIRHHLEQSVG